jgi:hypothetical protein
MEDVMDKAIYKPSQVMRLVKSGKIADQQPRGEGKIMCEEFRHVNTVAQTESPTFWENGTYTHCDECNALKLARVEFRDFVIDMTGERKKYPMTMPESET